MDHKITSKYLKIAEIVEKEIDNFPVLRNQNQVDDGLRVSPVGGYGRKMKRLRQWEKAVTTELIGLDFKRERGVYTNIGETVFFERLGTEDEVSIDGPELEIWLQTSETNVVSHTHPVQGINREFIDGSFSAQDLYNIRLGDIIETRAVTINYIHVVQMPTFIDDRDYTVWLQSFPPKEDFQEEFDNRLYPLNDQYRELYDKGYAWEASVHITVREFCRKYRVPYARYKNPYNPKNKKTE